MPEVESTLPKIRVGKAIPRRTLVTIHGERIDLPDPGRLVHLQFRRFAGCASCNLHLRSFAKRHAEIVAANIREVAVFYSAVANTD
jgi:peroxiredoxin